jgi:hypothetical protein
MLDELLTLLASPQRRRVLTLLLDAPSIEGDAGTLLESLRRIGDRDNDPDAPMADGSGDEQLRTALEHVHLPKLDAAGVVAWDRVAGRVARGPAFDDAEPVVRLLYDSRDDLPGDWF